MKNNSVNIILLIFSLCLIGYIVYDKVLSDKGKDVVQEEVVNNNEEIKEGNQNDNINNENNQETENNNDPKIDSNDKESISNDTEIYENIIEKYLLKLLGNKTLIETSNQDKLAMLFELYKNENGWKKEILKADLTKVKENSILKKIHIEYTDLSDYTMTNNYTDSKLYESNNQKYIYQNIGHKTNNVKIIHKELINSSFDNNFTTLTYNFVFSKTTTKGSSTTPGYHHLYYNYEDINNNKHFKDFSFLDIFEEIGNSIAYDNAKTYIKENYNDIKSKLYTYTFEFYNDENIIILKDYYRE